MIKYGLSAILLSLLEFCKLSVARIVEIFYWLVKHHGKAFENILPIACAGMQRLLVNFTPPANPKEENEVFLKKRSNGEVMA